MTADLSLRQLNVLSALRRVCKPWASAGLIYDCYDNRTLRSLVRRGYIEVDDEMGVRVLPDHRGA